MQRLSLFSLCWLLLLPPLARADGGTLRFTERIGGYQVALFTAPSPLRAGPVDFSVLVQDAETDKVLLDARVELILTRTASPGEPMHYMASPETATNKLLHAAQFELPDAGSYRMDLLIDGPHGSVHKEMVLEVEPPLPSWSDLWFWIALPFGAIILFIIHQRLVRRATARAAR
jgi:hypothetical protein